MEFKVHLHEQTNSGLFEGQPSRRFTYIRLARHACRTDAFIPDLSSLSPVRINQNLARLSRFQTRHRLGKVFHCNAVRNHRVQVQFPRL